MSIRWVNNLNLDTAGPAMRDGARRGLRIAGEHVLQVSNTRVPNEEGTLERSGRVSVDDAALVAAVSYDTRYAVPQHERLDYRHSDGRSAKYLERALTESGATAQDLIAAEVRRAVR